MLYDAQNAHIPHDTARPKHGNPPIVCLYLNLQRTRVMRMSTSLATKWDEVGEVCLMVLCLLHRGIFGTNSVNHSRKQVLACLGLAQLPPIECISGEEHAYAIVSLVGDLISNPTRQTTRSGEDYEEQMYRWKAQCGQVQQEQVARVREKLEYSRRETEQQKYLVQQAESAREKWYGNCKSKRKQWPR